MVGVAQLVEPRVVIPVVVGSSPIVHPILKTTGIYCCVIPVGLTDQPGHGLNLLTVVE